MFFYLCSLEVCLIVLLGLFQALLTLFFWRRRSLILFSLRRFCKYQRLVLVDPAFILSLCFNEVPGEGLDLCTDAPHVEENHRVYLDFVEGGTSLHCESHVLLAGDVLLIRGDLDTSALLKEDLLVLERLSEEELRLLPNLSVYDNSLLVPCCSISDVRD